jgi:hypothetical protein
MDTWLSFWGFQVRADWALYFIAAYLAASIALIIIIPRFAVPIGQNKDSSGKLSPLSADERSKIIDMRAKVRSTVMQVIGGLTVVGAFITSIQQIRGTEDAFNQKKAELFAKAVKELLSDSDKDAPVVASHAEAIDVLSFVARSDRSYHRPVFDTLSSYVNGLSAQLCQDQDQDHPKFRSADFHTDPTLQLAMRTIGERRVQDDPTGKRFNLEHGCFVGLDLKDEWGVVQGLQNTRMSGSKMLRVDFGKANLDGAELMGIEAGDYHNPGWTIEIGKDLHDGEDGDLRKSSNNGERRRRYVAHFVDAHLRGVDFSGAGLQGANFSGAILTDASFNGAVISRANFRGATGLTAKQLDKACVGSGNMTDAEFESEQPYFSKDLRMQVQATPGMEKGIRKCG